MFIFDKIDTVPFWKKIYQTASGYSPSITCDIVDEILTVTNKELIGGYKIYEAYSEEGFQKWEETLTDKDQELNNFIKRLCRCLNLQANVALPVFFNYLMFEYYGKIEDIKNLILYEHSVLSLLENVWQFYTSERMYYVKTLRHIFECAVRPGSPYKNEYVKFISKINIKDFRTTLITQLKLLINEITEESLNNSFDKKSYVNRNNREQLEFILLIIMTVEYKEILADEFSMLFNNFMLHNFTRQPVYFDTTLYGDPLEFNDVKNAEIGCFIIGIHQINDEIKMLPKTIESSLRDLQNQGDHKIVLFSWVLGKLKTFDESESQEISSYENLLRILIQSSTFNSIVEFLSTKLMKSDVRATKLIQAGVYKLIDEFFISMEFKDRLIHNKGLISSLVCLMEDSDISAVCTTAQGSLDVIVKTVFDQFPESFVNLTKFCTVLVKHADLSDAVISKLNNLSTSYAREKMETSMEDVHFPHSINYFDYLTNLVQKLFQAGNECKETVFQEILGGYELIYEIMKCDKVSVKCDFENCLNILDQFINIHETTQKFSQLLRINFHIRARMVLYQNWTIGQLFQGLKMGRKFLPKLLTQERNPEALMQRHIINSILVELLKKEEYESKHPTVKIYLELIHHCILRNLDVETIQIPGVIYMMTFVFPYHKNWHYVDTDEQVEISILCLKIMLEVFNRSIKKDDILKSFLFHSLLKNPLVMNTFLQYLIQEKFYLQKVMLNEVDWIEGRTLDRITLSKLHLSVFLRLLNECDLKPSDAVLKPKIQTVTKCAASFITNAFSCSLANLACRLLEKLSQDPDIPILAVLEMDYTQIQCLFLEKLRDPLEDDLFKMTALDFINTSLLSQNGLTAAFFNALDVLEKKENSKTVPSDSVCDFMIDYLQNIQKSPDYLTNPVQKSILRVFATLWSTGRENLVQDIYSLKCFWPLLTDPLFHPQIKDPEVYTHIMTITTIHIMEFQKNVDKNLKLVITNFFNNKKLIEEWINYIKSVLTVYTDDEQYKVATQLVFAWKKLVISIKTYIPDVITLKTVKCSLILSCLRGILWHFSVLTNNDVITDFSDLFLILIFTWQDCYNSEIETIELLTTVLNTYVANCKFPSFHNREVFLTMIHKTIQDCQELLQSNHHLLYNLLKPVGLLVDSEYNRLIGQHDDLNCKIRSVMCWVLVARVGDSIFSIKTVKPFSNFFKYHQYLSRMLESIRLLLNDTHTLPMVKMLLKTLNNYADSDIYMDFLSQNTTIIYDIIDNGKSIFPNSNKDELPISLKETWILYTMVIKLNHILFIKFGEKMIESNFTFLSVYDRVISQMICLPEFTVDSRALDLSCETLRYLMNMLHWSDIWSVKNIGSFSLIVMSIKKLLNSCISSILRPENIRFYKINKLGKLCYFYETPNRVVASVMNRILELSCLALQCLTKCNPSMTQLFSIEKPKSSAYLLIEYDFTIPKFDIPSTEDLTYGRLLCIIYFLCKTLNQEFSKDVVNESHSRVPNKSGKDVAKEKSLGEIFGKLTLFDEEYTGFIEYPKSNDLISQPIKLSAFLHYGEQTNSEPWIKYICKEKVSTTLEYLMNFLAVQVFYHVHILQKPQLHYFKRELYSELQFFNDFAKKLATDEYTKLVPKRKSDGQNVDVINRFLSERMSMDKNLDDICDKFFLLAASKWFMNICQLS